MEPAPPQRLYSLTPIKTGSGKEPAAQNDTADYPSCRYIEGGLSFTYSDIRACATVHHKRGAPFLQDLRGKDPVMNLQTILESRDSIREVNRNGGGHPECVGCPRFVRDA